MRSLLFAATLAACANADTPVDATIGADATIAADASIDAAIACDEGVALLGTPCTLGTGACLASGVYVCAVDAIECNATPGQPQTELCNGLDEDCDGTPDNGFQINMACDGLADSDLCTEGVWACDGNGGRTCTDATASTTDNCGNGDEDCDPESADGSEHPGLGATCDGADSDLCLEGTSQCSGTALGCSDATGSTFDLCGNGNEDCDPASADGSEDPAVGISCDGTADTDMCKEAVSTCASGSVSCLDNTGSTVEACSGNAVDENCNGVIDEGFAWQAESPACSAGVNLTVSGDTGSTVATDTWYNAEWDRLLITEDSDSSIYVSATVELYSPPGVDYDLYAYCFGCGGSFVTSSTNGGLTGHYDTITLRADDDAGEEDDHYVYIEIRYFAANRCARWTLTATGNTPVSTPTCNP